MPTLANIQGGSLVADLSGPIKTFEALAERKRKKRAEREALDALRTAGGLPTPPTAAGGGDGLLGSLRSLLGGQETAAGPVQAVPRPGRGQDDGALDNAVRGALGQRVPQPVKSESVNLLGQVNSAVAQEAAGVAERGSEVESAEFREVATKGMAMAKELHGLPNFASRQRRLAKMATEAISSGNPQDQQRLLQLMNLDEAHLGLELTKMQITGRGMLAAVPEIKPTGPFRLFKTPEQRDALAKLMITNPRAAATMIDNRRFNLAEEKAAAAPQTDLAQTLADIQTDLTAGRITSETADQMIANARTEATQAAPVPFSGNVPAGFMLKDPANPRAGVVRIPGVPVKAAPVKFSGKVPAGMMLIDPNNPRKGVIPIPGAPVEPPEPVPFSGKVPAGMMLADPNDPRAGVIPIPGAPVEVSEGTTAQATAEAKIQRIMDDQNVDRPTAQGIVDGVLKVTRDPTTQEIVITNLATGESTLPATPDAPGAPPPAQSEDVLSSAPVDIGSITAALGGQGIIVDALNTVADVFSLPIPGPQTDKAVITLNSLGTRTMLGLAAEFPGRPSNLTRERIEKLLVKPASLSAGPVRGLNKFKNVRETVATSLRIAESVSSGRVVAPTGRITKRKFTPAQVGEANAAILGLIPLLEEYDTIITQMESGSEGAKTGVTPSGIEWSIQP